MAQSQWIVNVTEQNFTVEVLARSRTTPVLVDFWAQWCNPCRTLGPVLEKLAIEMNGRFVLAKINSDENQGLSQKFGVRSIPSCKLVINGQLANEFNGALPESAIRRFLDEAIPSEADALASQAGMLEDQGDEVNAAVCYNAALELNPKHLESLLGLARLLLVAERHEEAEAMLQRVAPEDAQRPEVKQLRAQMVFKDRGGDLDTLRHKVADNPKDLVARLALGETLAAMGEHEDALEQFLAIVRQDRSFQEDAGRKAMVQVFDLLGPASPVVKSYRSQLSAVLFS